MTQVNEARTCQQTSKRRRTSSTGRRWKSCGLRTIGPIKRRLSKRRGSNAPKELDDVKNQLARPLTEPTLPNLDKSSLDELKESHAQAEAGQTRCESELTDLDAAYRHRGDRFEEVRVLDMAAKQRLEDLDQQLAAVAAGLDRLGPLDWAQRA